jgi:hypothetical protein
MRIGTGWWPGGPLAAFEVPACDPDALSEGAPAEPELDVAPVPADVEEPHPAASAASAAASRQPTVARERTGPA